MKIKQTITYVAAIAFLLTTFQGCASYMHGYTSDKSLNRYLFVNQELDNFGYKRLQYNKGYYELKSFLEKNGTPDFFIENKEKGKRLRITFFYVKEDKAITMEEKGFGGNLSYIENRPLSDYEKATYNELKQKG
jgi:hypothetical protein